MDWIPVVFIVFKVLVFGTGMFFAIKWHYDQGRQGRQHERRKVLIAAGKVAAAFVLLLTALMLVVFFLSKKAGLDLNLP